MKKATVVRDTLDSMQSIWDRQFSVSHEAEESCLAATNYRRTDEGADRHLKDGAGNNQTLAKFDDDGGKPLTENCQDVLRASCRQ